MLARIINAGDCDKMKLLLRIAVMALFITGQTVNETLATAAAGPVSFEQSIATLVLASLGQAPGGEDRKAVLRLHLRAYYAGWNVAPIWVDENGATKKARDAAQEIRAADVFGLNPKDYVIPALDGAATTREDLARLELAMTRTVLEFAHHAKAGRIAPGKAGHSLNKPESLTNPRGFLDALRAGSDVAALLRGLHPRHPQFVALQNKLAELRGGGKDSPRILIPGGPVLRTGVAHEHVALLRKRLGLEGKSNRFDDALKAAVIAFQNKQGLKADGVAGNVTRRALNGAANERLIMRILVNMERWRWLPDDMGGGAGIYVWANIPEFRVRIVKNGEIAFTERAIVGKPGKQTPVFSDAMEWIEFHPTWYVPNSIKVEDIAPSLRRPASKVVERYHLKIDCGPLGRDWRTIDWETTDIRKCSVSQPPGERSVMGYFKFKFPNAHAVYMHDTPAKRLFKSAIRAYSHGCVRIQNPRRMAEVLLAHDKGLTASRIDTILKGPRRLHKEELTRHVPVHMTYFTNIFDKDGALRTLADLYGHDRRLAQLLRGKGRLLPVPVFASKHKRKKRIMQTAQETAWSEMLTVN